MNSELVRTSDEPTPAATWFVYLAFALAAAFVCSIVAYSVIYGPQLRAEAEKRMTQEMAQENEAVCSKLGMPSGSQAFAGCAAELTQVRLRHEARLNREFEY